MVAAVSVMRLQHLPHRMPYSCTVRKIHRSCACVSVMILDVHMSVLVYLSSAVSIFGCAYLG